MIHSNKTEFVEKIQSVKVEMNNMKGDLIREMKSDKSELVEMIHSNKSELVEIIHSNKTELIEKLQSNKTELFAMIGRSKVATIFWIVWLGIVQIDRMSKRLNSRHSCASRMQ